MKKGIMLVFVLSLILGAPFRMASAKSYWLTGAGIGAGIFGAGVGITAGVGCAQGTERDAAGACALLGLVSSVGGAAVGFGLGAVIGSAFKKKEPTMTTIIDPITGTYGASVNMPF